MYFLLLRGYTVMLRAKRKTQAGVKPSAHVTLTPLCLPETFV